MPENAVARAPPVVNSESLLSVGNGQPVSTASSFYPAYEVEDEAVGPVSPQPIKVTRAKKKGTSSGKKKRTLQVDDPPS